MKRIEALLEPYRDQWPSREWINEATERIRVVRESFARNAERLMTATTPEDFTASHNELEHDIEALRYAFGVKRDLVRAHERLVEPIMIPTPPREGE